MEERPAWVRALRVFLFGLFLIGAVGFGAVFYLTHKFTGGPLRPVQTVANIGSLMSAGLDPAKKFPGRERINLLCMGLDRNWTRDNMPYTKNARTDTMMLASLDLATKSVAVLSIPRDTWVRLPGMRGHTKINSAHERGGIPYTIKTVEEFLGTHVDYYVVIKQEAIQGAIDKLGGLQVKVDKQMDYDDNWGHLHVHLKPGEQNLSGEQVVGYMRFRKDAEGDFGRIRRQQQVVQLLSQRMKEPSVIFSLGELFDVLNEYVKTNLSREQILALGAMFHHVEPQNLLTASVPCSPGPRGDIAYLVPDDAKKELLVKWLIDGDEEAANQLTTVEVVNRSGSRRLGQETVTWLKDLGFKVRVSSPRGETKPLAQTELVDHGTLPRSARRVLAALGIPGKVEKDPDAKRRIGGPDVTLTVGRNVTANPSIAAAAEDDVAQIH